MCLTRQLDLQLIPLHRLSGWFRPRIPSIAFFLKSWKSPLADITRSFARHSSTSHIDIAQNNVTILWPNTVRQCPCATFSIGLAERDAQKGPHRWVQVLVNFPFRPTCHQPPKSDMRLSEHVAHLHCIETMSLVNTIEFRNIECNTAMIFKMIVCCMIAGCNVLMWSFLFLNDTSHENVADAPQNGSLFFESCFHVYLFTRELFAG